ncbi:MAG: hypothetical protein ABEJ58_08190, partial [Halodesulfurarchaeum sp.]
MSQKRTLAWLLSALLVFSIVGPGVVSAQESMTIQVTQSPTNGVAIVSISNSNTDDPIEDVNVTVTANETYNGTGEYVTDDSGNVTLPAPNETVSVTLNATKGSLNDTVTETLVPLSKSLDVAISQNESTGTVTITVEQYGEPINASVTVSADDYEESGEYQTGDDGTLSLAPPQKQVEVTVTAQSGNITATESAVLDPQDLMLDVSQDAQNWVIIEVTAGGSPVDGANVTVEGNYSEAGSYVTDDAGTVELSPPEKNVTITVTATYGNKTVTEQERIEAVQVNQTRPFGLQLVRFIHALQAHGVDGPMGQEVSQFVHAFNPSSADDDAGPPEEAGPPEHAGPP